MIATKLRVPDYICKTCKLPLAMHPELGGQTVCIIEPATTTIQVTS